MFLTFFTELRAAQVPVTLREYLTMLEALDADLADKKVEDFYYLSRACLVKDERNLDKFDRVFGHVFRGIESLAAALESAEIPAEWLRKLAEKYLTEEEKRQLEAMGWDKLLETLRSASRSRRGATRAARNGSAPPAPRPMAPTATTPKASASARTATATSAPSRCGTSASSRTSTTPSSSASATCASRCGGCAASPARARPRSSTSTP